MACSLRWSPPCQHYSLAGQEHGRTIPLPDLASLHFLGSFHQSDVARLPTLVDCTFSRAVKPENDEIRLTRHGREPVALYAFRCFRTKVKVGASIGVLRRLIARTQRRERLAIGETRGVFRIVKRLDQKMRAGILGGR